MRFTVVTPDYTIPSAGVWCLHRLAHLLSVVGHYVLVTTDVVGPWGTYEVIKPGQNPGTLILPEIVDFPNPNKALCVRWVLNVPGKIGGPTKYTPAEMVWHYNDDLEAPARAAAADGVSRQLLLAVIDLKDFAPMTKDLSGCWYQGKYKGKIPPIPDPLALRITPHWPINHVETLQILRRSKVYYSLDNYTMMNLEAYLAGAQVKWWNDDQWCDYAPTPAEYARFVIDEERDLQMVKDFADAVAVWIRKMVQLKMTQTDKVVRL